MPRRWLTRANLLTLLRLLSAPALYLAVVDDRAGVATAIFSFAVATDVADGWVARRYGEATPLGGLADHSVDAIFVTTGAAALAAVGLLPVVLAPLIAAAFTQYMLDSGALATRGLRASSLGRYNGIAYYVIVAIPVVRDALGLQWPAPGLVMGLGWALVASTLLSMADRLRLSLSGTRRRGAGAPE
jgi:phosphatidylglycerophosphate synthase